MNDTGDMSRALPWHLFTSPDYESCLPGCSPPSPIHPLPLLVSIENNLVIVFFPTDNLNVATISTSDTED